MVAGAAENRLCERIRDTALSIVEIHPDAG
jgi:hypothetical protein